MDRMIRRRITFVTAMLLVFLLLFAFRLISMQLADKGETEYREANVTTYIQYVPAARGNILDCRGNVLVQNRAAYNVEMQSYVLFNSEDPNGNLLKLARCCQEYDIEYRDRLPLSKEAPYTFILDEMGDQEQYIYKRFLLGRQWDADMTAENLYKLLKESYHIDETYTAEETRLIMGLRYELDLPIYAYTDTYTLAEDVAADRLSILEQLRIPGLDVVATTVREYNTDYAAQVLGAVGAVDAEEYEEKYKDLEYSMNAYVGKFGMEEAFEEYLHGTDGQKKVTVAEDGTVISEEWLVEPQSGANVITSIDIGMQELAEHTLAERIKSMSSQGDEDGYDADSGACVVMNVNTGEILACACYPTYSPKDYKSDYEELSKDPGKPLLNRAMGLAYPPGSTFKMITSIAAMRYGINPLFTVNATGVYTKYAEQGYAPVCWYYTSYHAGHGAVDMRTALAASCNIYFYTVGDRMGIDPIVEVAEDFGFGQDAGCELWNNPGQMASPELKESLFDGQIHSDWYAADTLMASIGQSYTEVTPLQLCRYVATVGNGGTLYNATFFRRAVSSDFQSLVAENTFEPVAENLITDEEWQVLQEGMVQCVSNQFLGTAEKYFRGYTTTTVAGKTGTAQHGNGGSDNGAFVCFAPAVDPEIAVAVYVEHGSTGGYFSPIAMDVMDYYFNRQDVSQEIVEENTMIFD